MKGLVREVFLHLAWQADSSRHLGTSSHRQIADRYVELQVLLEM